MTIVLRAKNKSCFVNGSIERPIDVKELQQWQRCKDLVSSWILNLTDNEICASIFYVETADFVMGLQFIGHHLERILLG